MECETGNNPSPSLRVCDAEGTWFHFLNSEHEFNTAIDKKKTTTCKCLQIEALNLKIEQKSFGNNTVLFLQPFPRNDQVSMFRIFKNNFL